MALLDQKLKSVANFFLSKSVSGYFKTKKKKEKKVSNDHQAEGGGKGLSGHVH